MLPLWHYRQLHPPPQLLWVRMKSPLNNLTLMGHSKIQHTHTHTSVFSSKCFLPGYSEDGGAQKGEVFPEHEFAESPVRLDDENEFPPVGN